MRALSLRQPFAWLTVKEGPRKPIENRTWLTEFRGWFLVHASAQWHDRDRQLAIGMLARMEREGQDHWQLRRDLAALYRNGPELGGIVGAAQLTGVLEPQAPEEIPQDWRLPGQYGYCLTRVVALPFTPCKGLQRFWRVKPETQEQLRLKTPDWLWLALQKND